MSLWSFQGARAIEAPHGEKPARRPVSQNSAANAGGRTGKARTTFNRHRKRRRCVEVDVVLGESEAGRLMKLSHRRVRRLRSKSSGFPRKEVIQPQLPLRLPCYDFTPVTDPTFGGSLPCGLGHRLRVLPASVV